VRKSSVEAGEERVSGEVENEVDGGTVKDQVGCRVST
jgi:hypothetical protein